MAVRNTQTSLQRTIQLQVLRTARTTFKSVFPNSTFQHAVMHFSKNQMAVSHMMQFKLSQNMLSMDILQKLFVMHHVTKKKH